MSNAEAIKKLEKAREITGSDCYTQTEIYDANEFINEALSLLQSLAGKQPKCFTCGDTGNPCSSCGEYHSPSVMCPPHEVRMKWAPDICPDCKLRPQQPEPEAVKLLEKVLRIFDGEKDPLFSTREIIKQALSLLQPLGKQPEAERPEIVCLCGSTRFMEAFFEAGWKFTLEGKIVLSVGVCKHAEHHGAEALGQDVADRLDELHLRKIDLADSVFVLNVGGYIGESTREEIEYAESLNKPIGYLESCGSADEQPEYKTEQQPIICPRCNKPTEGTHNYGCPNDPTASQQPEAYDDPKEWPHQIRLRAKTKKEFYCKLRAIIPEDLFALTKTSQLIIRQAQQKAEAVAARVQAENECCVLRGKLEKLRERYGDYERLWVIAKQGNCDGNCKMQPAFEDCPECLAKHAINELGEIRDGHLRVIDQAVKVEAKDANQSF